VATWATGTKDRWLALDIHGITGPASSSIFVEGGSMDAKRVLIVHGSKRGGTAEIAAWIGASLRAEGMEADVVAAGSVRDLGPYDAVVVGGALYAMRWHRDARHFVRRYRDALSERPVWLFSSGPLDRSAEERDIAPVRSVARATRRIGARGHVTFGGRLTPDPGGRIATGMAKKSAGDFRNREQVEAWAREIVAALRPSTAAPLR
jgi:menaquinone-dependent protoporphyrinogen oxidase